MRIKIEKEHTESELYIQDIYKIYSITNVIDITVPWLDSLPTSKLIGKVKIVSDKYWRHNCNQCPEVKRAEQMWRQEEILRENLRQVFEGSRADWIVECMRYEIARNYDENMIMGLEWEEKHETK